VAVLMQDVRTSPAAGPTNSREDKDLRAGRGIRVREAVPEIGRRPLTEAGLGRRTADRRPTGLRQAIDPGLHRKIVDLRPTELRRPIGPDLQGRIADRRQTGPASRREIEGAHLTVLVRAVALGTKANVARPAGQARLAPRVDLARVAAACPEAAAVEDVEAEGEAAGDASIQSWENL